MTSVRLRLRYARSSVGRQSGCATTTTTTTTTRLLTLSNVAGARGLLSRHANCALSNITASTCKTNITASMCKKQQQKHSVMHVPASTPRYWNVDLKSNRRYAVVVWMWRCWNVVVLKSNRRNAVVVWMWRCWNVSCTQCMLYLSNVLGACDSLYGRRSSIKLKDQLAGFISPLKPVPPAITVLYLWAFFTEDRTGG